MKIMDRVLEYRDSPDTYWFICVCYPQCRLSGMIKCWRKISVKWGKIYFGLWS